MSSHVEPVASEPGVALPPANPNALVPPLAVPTHRSRPLGQRILTALRTATIPQRFLALLLIIFVAKGIVITLVFPPYSGHDEVAHYTYLRFIAEEGRPPLIPDLETWTRDYQETGEAPHDKLPAELWEYCRYTTSDWVGCGDPRCDEPCYVAVAPPNWNQVPSGWVYTANHPPLYYLLMTPVYWLMAGQSLETQLYALRLAAIPFGMATVLFAYLTVRTLFPRDRFLALTVPAFVAFQPQISYEAAMLNNDILAIACTSAVIYLIVLGLRRRFPVWTCLLIGLCFGLAMLAKSTSVTSAVLIAFAMVFGLGLRNVRAWLPRGVITAAVAALLVAPWLAYMWITYGDLTALDEISTLQSWWNDRGVEGRTLWSMLSDRGFFWLRWHETWGAFGWRLIFLDDMLLRVLLWITLAATVGLAVYAVRFLRMQRCIDAAEEAGENVAAMRYHADPTLAIMPWQVVGILTMGVTCVVAYYAILQFGMSFSLTQARYYFPAIVPAAILFMLGVRAWFPRRWLPYVQAVAFAALVLLNLIIYTAYVIPYWHPSV